MAEPRTELHVNRRSKVYAFFIDGEQDGNWMLYVNESEPQRIADEMDIPLVEEQ